VAQEVRASPVVAESPEAPARASRKLAALLGLPAVPEGCTPVEEWRPLVQLALLVQVE